MMETKLEKLGGWIVVLGAIFPAMIASGFFSAWNVMGFDAWLAVAAAVCCIGGVIYALGAPRFWHVGLLCGSLVGAGALGALWLYTDLRSAWGVRFYKIEIAIVLLIGGLPGTLLFRFLRKSRLRPEAVARSPVSTDARRP